MQSYAYARHATAHRTMRRALYNILTGGRAMRTLSCIVVALTLALGSFIAPVLGAEDHMMVTPERSAMG
jgi:hypothetical protein